MRRRSCSSKLVWNTYCAKRGAAIAESASRTRTATAPIVRRSRRRLYHAFVQSPAEARRVVGAGTRSARATVDISSHLDPRIHARVRDVAEQVADHQQSAGEHDPGHDEGVVLAANGRVGELANPGPGEDLFDDERAADERREDSAEGGHDGDQGVAER